MAPRASITIEKLAELGTEKLAQLVLDEMERDASFRRIVKAALAAKKGPDAIAKMIDRRLSSLEKARSFIDWDRARAFRDDLQSTLITISDELAKVAPDLAAERLLRFVKTHEQVFRRIDDSYGSVQAVYEEAIEALGNVASQLDAQQAEKLPNMVIDVLGETSHGYLLSTIRTIAPHIPEKALLATDKDFERKLKEKEEALKRNKEKFKNYSFFGEQAQINQMREARQIIAQSVGNIDLFIALENQKEHKNVVLIASKLFEAKRYQEALEWLRPEINDREYRRKRSADNELRSHMVRQTDYDLTVLETKILIAINQKKEALELLWDFFEVTLDAAILRQYVECLDDFEEFEALDRAFDYAFKETNSERVLSFFLAWPKLDSAAKLVLARRELWNGRAYYQLASAAKALETDYPEAATILYRALLNEILGEGNSKAYSHGAKYLEKLTELSEGSLSLPADMEDHAAYHANLLNKHKRKASFWQLVNE